MGQVSTCTSALEGKTGIEGPVCEGYARTFTRKNEYPSILTSIWTVDWSVLKPRTQAVLQNLYKTSRK